MVDTKQETKIRKYSNHWYTMGRSFLPEFDTPQFSRLAGSSTAFAYTLNPGDNGNITIRLSKNIETAYVDLLSKTIFISENYFSSEMYNARFDSPEQIEELAIALINGSTIHESLHLLYTANRGDGTIPAILEMSYLYPKYKRQYGEQLLCILFNITEDLYIDSMVPKNLTKWLQNRAEILFSEDDLNSMEFDETDLTSYVNLMVYYKNKRIRGNSKFEKLGWEIKSLLKELTNKIEVDQIRRVQLAFEIADLLPKFDGKDKTKGESGEGEADDGEGEEIKMDGEIPEELKALLASIDGLTDEEFKAIASEVSEESEAIAKAEKETESFGTLRWKKLLEEDVMKMSYSTYGRFIRVDPTSEINFSFLKELQAIRTLNRTPGEARTRGSVMVKSRLTRIATDGKIFAKMDTERKTLKRIEVIINVDFSASTSGDVINNELGAAKEMSKVLKSARIAHSVYGHTSKNSDIPLLIHIFSYDMKTTNFDWEKRFEKAATIALAENYDGVVIAKLQEKFTGKNATKYIINLSDGYPAGPGYHGKESANHTRQIVNDTRKLGIGVFAISVVSHVVEPNNRIYGNANNIDGSKNVNSQFRRLIRKLVS